MIAAKTKVRAKRREDRNADKPKNTATFENQNWEPIVILEVLPHARENELPLCGLAAC